MYVGIGKWSVSLPFPDCIIHSQSASMNSAPIKWTRSYVVLEGFWRFMSPLCSMVLCISDQCAHFVHHFHNFLLRSFSSGSPLFGVTHFHESGLFFSSAWVTSPLSSWIYGHNGIPAHNDSRFLFHLVLCWWASLDEFVQLCMEGHEGCVLFWQDC